MKKNKIKEGALDAGIQSYQTTSVQPKTPENGVKKPTLNVKKNDLTKIVPQLKGDDVNVNVVEGEEAKGSKKLEYLSDVHDEHDEISKPFKLNGKNYQMVRALTPQNEKVLGVYSMDEVDEDGKNIIHPVDEFEKSLDNQPKQNETGVQEPEAPQANTLNPEGPVVEKTPETTTKSDNPSFAGHKHFIVNRKTGKAKKFKDISELAKAQMGEGEEYMGIRDFKKYVDETLFGAGKKQNLDEIQPTGQENDAEMNVKAKKLIDLITKKVPSGIFKSIATPVAQREVIASFAEMIGVPRNGLSTLIAGLKDLAVNNAAGTASNPNKAAAQVTTSQATGNVSEGRKIIQTIKVKDIK